jgi:hypothetical protein
MAVVDLLKLGLYTSIRKKLNRDTTVYPDHPSLGAGFKPELIAGVYQMRRRPYLGTGHLHPRFGPDICVREKFYQPSCQTQPNKVISQNKFRDAVVAWQNLTIDQKKIYNKRAVGRGFSGYNLFIRNYMHG